MKMRVAATTVAELGAEQCGIITTAQARGLGVTAVQIARLSESGALERLHHGIYRMTRIPHDAHQDLRVAWTALDRHCPAWQRLTQHSPSGVVSHRSAARMHQLGDIDADILEFTCRRRVRLTMRDVRIHAGEIERDD